MRPAVTTILPMSSLAFVECCRRKLDYDLTRWVGGDEVGSAPAGAIGVQRVCGKRRHVYEMKRKVRGFDGVTREVDDDYVLLDGESVLVDPMIWMRRRSMIHDGNGSPVGQRPGFLVRDDECGRTGGRGCLSGIRRRHQPTLAQGPGQRQARRHPTPQTFDNPEAARAAAYANMTGHSGALAQMTDYQSCRHPCWRRSRTHR